MTLVLAALLLAPGPDQPGAEDPVEAAFARAKELYGMPDPRLRCRPGPDGEIVVCADRGEDLKVPSSAESDPRSRAALRNGVPSAPQLDRGSCKGQPGCIVGGWAPPPVYYIDLTAIPEPAPGRDADRIARGEIPPP